ncbi:MAG: hypothetical protein GYA50_08605, partial [Eubacteriaceae bacterium]|nr:hypothetical protein [Eubacteriaceae bacterium]
KYEEDDWRKAGKIYNCLRDIETYISYFNDLLNELGYYKKELKDLKYQIKLVENYENNLVIQKKVKALVNDKTIELIFNNETLESLLKRVKEIENRKINK